MASVIGIYNIALARIGVDKTVASIGEASKEARLCTRFYEQCRDEVLEAAAWPFAVKTQALSPLADAGKLPGWGYQYAQPSDCLRVLELADADAVGTALGYWAGCSGPWDAFNREGAHAFRKALANDGNSVVLLSNQATPYGIYVARVTNPEVFSPLMVSALADRLAMELAMPMTGTPQWFQVAQQRYAASFTTAASTQYDQDAPTTAPTAPAILARQ